MPNPLTEENTQEVVIRVMEAFVKQGLPMPDVGKLDGRVRSLLTGFNVKPEPYHCRQCNNVTVGTTSSFICGFCGVKNE